MLEQFETTLSKAFEKINNKFIKIQKYIINNIQDTNTISHIIIEHEFEDNYYTIKLIFKDDVLYYIIDNTYEIEVPEKSHYLVNAISIKDIRLLLSPILIRIISKDYKLLATLTE